MMFVGQRRPPLLFDIPDSTTNDTVGRDSLYHRHYLTVIRNKGKKDKAHVVECSILKDRYICLRESDHIWALEAKNDWARHNYEKQTSGLPRTEC